MKTRMILAASLALAFAAPAFAQNNTPPASPADDQAAPAGDRLRAMEQLESRALGKPKESVTVDTEESDAERALRALTPEERLQLWRRRGLRAADEPSTAD